MTGHTRRTGAALAAVVTVVAVLAAGCGGGSDSSFADQSTETITQAASADMKALKTLHITGDVTTNGQRIDLDMRSTTDGECQGTVEVASGSAQIVSSRGSYWMKPDKAFWKQTAGAQASVIEQAVGDKWVTVPANSGLDEVCDLDNFLKAFDNASGNDPSASPSSAGTEQIDGQDAVKIAGEEKGQPVAAWVATADPHYILKLEVGGASDGGTLSFSDFDQPVDVKTPSPSEVVDLSQLAG
ncbi:MAG TPA: hypothetical protein VFJ89_02600 [Nocardioides sp.]|jgi:hypothetical protein|nr:hypothetical protein [Nocardioides sp.]